MPGGRKPRSEVLVYEGRRYTWSPKGYWRCTKRGDRHNLARWIWERANGPVPKGHRVYYRDGNRFNVTLENLECLSIADYQRRRLSSEISRAINLCQLTYGRLLLSIMNKLNPAFKKERYRKVVETRRERYGPSMGNKGRGNERK